MGPITDQLQGSQLHCLLQKVQYCKLGMSHGQGRAKAKRKGRDDVERGKTNTPWHAVL